MAFDDSDSVDTTVLDGDRSVRGIVNAIKSGKVKKVCVLTGAGISCATGIPDFRSPDTGIYNNTEKYGLPNPEALFELDYFKQHPETFYSFIREVFSGVYRPTLAHCFLRLLYDKGILLRVYSQNIDGLERATGIPDSFLVEAHGSFRTASCIDCGTEYPIHRWRQDVRENRIPKCSCGETIKPDIVLYGEPLPLRYTWMHTADMVSCDLVIVMGTSLSVQPFYSLLQQVRENVPRLLINREAVGPFRFCNMESCLRDVFIQAECDDGVIEFCQQLGWEDELRTIYRSVNSISILDEE